MACTGTNLPIPCSCGHMKK